MYRCRLSFITKNKLSRSSKTFKVNARAAGKITSEIRNHSNKRKTQINKFYNGSSKYMEFLRKQLLRENLVHGKIIVRLK